MWNISTKSNNIFIFLGSFLIFSCILLATTGPNKYLSNNVIFKVFDFKISYKQGVPDFIKILNILEFLFNPFKYFERYL